MEGFIFEIKKHYYFIQTYKTKRSKTLSQKLFNYITYKENIDVINMPIEVINNTINKIYKEMYKVKLIPAEYDRNMIHIRTDYSGDTIDIHNIDIIKEVI